MVEVEVAEEPARDVTFIVSDLFGSSFFGKTLFLFG